MAERKIINMLQSYLKLLTSEGVAIDKAFLYGSYLTNSQTDESDIDLMIVTNEVSDDDTIGKIWSMTKKINSKIEPYLIDKKRFDAHNTSPLISLVKSKGLLIYS